MTSSEHVIIDIPETNLPTPLSQYEEQTEESVGQAQDKDNLPESEQSYNVQPRHVALPESEPDEPRRSARERRPPHKLTYDELGKPLVLALSSFLESLHALLPQLQISPVTYLFGTYTHAETHAV